MSDPGFDPCECFNPAAAMRRLISLLRQSQNYCTDEQCFGEQPGPNSDAGDANLTLFMMFVAWVVLAATLYMFRPASIQDGSSKPVNDEDNNDHRRDNNGPRQPPPVM